MKYYLKFLFYYFYGSIDIKTSNAQANVTRLEREADSLKKILNAKSYQTASLMVADANPAYKQGLVPMELTQRDPQFIEYCERIAKYYFNGTIKQVNPMQAMMQNMMGGGGGANPMKMIGGK